MADETDRDFSTWDTAKTVLFSVAGGLAFAIVVYSIGIYWVRGARTGIYGTSVTGFLAVSGILGRFLWSNYYGPES